MQQYEIPEIGTNLIGHKSPIKISTVTEQDKSSVARRTENMNFTRVTNGRGRRSTNSNPKRKETVQFYGGSD